MNNAFARLLGRRRDPETGERMSVSLLAKMVVTGRSHLSQVLSGKRPGGETWGLVLPLLTREEAVVLGRGAEWDRFHGEQERDKGVMEGRVGVLENKRLDERKIMKATVIYHRADFDGLFCREIARRFLPTGTEFVGWDFGDGPVELTLNKDSLVYVLDLPVDRVFGYDFKGSVDERLYGLLERIVWIDHHKSAIESHPSSIAGYRIDGVAACRLVWQWFNFKLSTGGYAAKEHFVERKVIEPWAVRLAGEYDVWDKRDPSAETLQHGLRSMELTEEVWDGMLQTEPRYPLIVDKLLRQGEFVQYARKQSDESLIRRNGFRMRWEGLNWLCVNTAQFNSLLFASALQPGDEGLLGFNWTGRVWKCSLYHAPGHEKHDLSVIATKWGGGGHRGACGFTCDLLPFRMEMWKAGSESKVQGPKSKEESR